MRVFIDRVEVRNFRPQSLSVGDGVNARSTGKVQFYKVPGFSLKSGQHIEIYNDEGQIVFGGLVNRPRQIELSEGGRIGIEAEIVDNQAIGERRIVAETYLNQTCGFIVKDIHKKYLEAEGVTLGIIEEGPTITSAVFPYVNVAKVYDDLTEISGYSWYISADRVLHFTSRGAFTAPWNITPEHRPIKKVEVETDLNQYRNRQILRAGQDLTDLQRENFNADGKQTTFTVGYKIAQKPILRVNGVEVNGNDVGIRGLDKEKLFYWSKNEKEITTDEQDETPLLAQGDTLTVEYYGFYPIIVIAEDAAAIRERQEAQGGTGLFEAADQNANIDNGESALQFAEGKLRRYAHVNTKVKFETFKPGLRAGQVIEIDLPEFDVSGDFLITNTGIQELREGLIVTSVEAVDGEDVGGWQTFFKKIAAAGETFIIRENEVLLLLASQNERIGLKEKMQYQVFACPVPSVNLFPSVDIYPC